MRWGSGLRDRAEILIVFGPLESYLRITGRGYRRTTTGRVRAAQAYCMQAIHHSGRENAMTTTTTTRGAQRATPVTTATGTQEGARWPGTSGVVAGLLMVTGIGWNAGLEARPNLALKQPGCRR